MKLAKSDPFQEKDRTLLRCVHDSIHDVLAEVEKLRAEISDLPLVSLDEAREILAVRPSYVCPSCGTKMEEEPPKPSESLVPLKKPNPSHGVSYFR